MATEVDQDGFPLLEAEQAPKVAPALEEILTSERAYVHSLELLVETYLPTLRQLLPDDDVATIFGSSEAILGVNRTLLASLEQALGPATAAACLGERAHAVATTFLSAQLLKAYSLYCANHVWATLRLLKCTEEQPAFRAALQRVEAAQQVTHCNGRVAVR